jgi:hypothetical protein
MLDRTSVLGLYVMVSRLTRHTIVRRLLKLDKHASH